MIPENALEDMTKNMDLNLVIVEVKDGVQMKWVLDPTISWNPKKIEMTLLKS